MTRHAPRKQLRLALPVLVASIVCAVAVPAPVLAQPGQGHGRQQRDDDYYTPSRSDRGDKPGRGQSRQRYRNADADDHTDDHNDRQRQQGRALSAQGAAQRARSQYGGQVLKVQPSGQGYQVRLLKEDGRVVTVPIAD